MISRIITHAACFAVLLGALGAAAGARPTDPAAGAFEPELSSLATPADVAAAGEATAGNRGSEDGKSVEVDGETIPVEEREIRLEGTSFRSLYRSGPAQVPK